MYKNIDEMHKFIFTYFFSYNLLNVFAIIINS